MRFRTFFGWVFWLGLLVYVGYAVVALGSSYFQIRALVEAAVRDSAYGQAAGAAVGTRLNSSEVVEEVRANIFLRARRAGLALDARKVAVSTAPNTVRVKVSWTHPILFYGGETVLSVPLFHERSFDTRNAR